MSNILLRHSRNPRRGDYYNAFCVRGSIICSTRVVTFVQGVYVPKQQPGFQGRCEEGLSTNTPVSRRVLQNNNMQHETHGVAVL